MISFLGSSVFHALQLEQERMADHLDLLERSYSWLERVVGFSDGTT